jgi:hypothetical protein
MSTNSSGSKLQATLAGIPIVTAVLYLLGSFFYQGFMGKLNLEGSQFPLAVDQNLFYGFFALISLSAKQIVFFMIAAESSVAVSSMAIYLSSSERFRASAVRLIQLFQRKDKTPPPLQTPPKVAWIAKFSAQMLIISIVIFILILGVTLVAWSASHSGEESAKVLLKKIEDGKQPSVDIFLVGKRDPINGFTLLCNATHCAYLVNKDVVIYPLSGIEKTIAHKILVDANAMR